MYQHTLRLQHPILVMFTHYSCLDTIYSIRGWGREPHPLTRQLLGERVSSALAIMGQYDVIFRFADHKAEKFFSCHGFTDDLIITARYKYISI